MKTQTKRMKQLLYAMLAMGLLVFFNACSSEDQNVLGDGAISIGQPFFIAAEDGAKIEKKYSLKSDNELRKRYVRFNEEAFQKQVLEGKDGDVVELALFDDVKLKIKRTDLAEKEEGVYVWQGEVEAEYYSKVILTVYRNIVMAQIQVDDKMYHIWPTDETYLSIAELDSGDFPTEIDDHDEDEEHEHDENYEEGALPKADLRATTTMRVLVLFPEQLDFICQPILGTTVTLATLVKSSYEANANAVYNAYNTTPTAPRIELEIVVECIDYVAVEGDLKADLQFIRLSSSVASLRNQHKADLVSLIVANSPFCGRGQYNTPPINMADRNRVFSVVKQSCALNNYSFVHELGHNMGMKHDRWTTNYLLNNQCNFGFFVEENGVRASRTVMTYGRNSVCNRCPRIGRYSNNVTRIVSGNTVQYGVSCNSPILGYDGPADNQNFLQTAAPVVRNFR